MSERIYIVAEGVQDVGLIARMLRARGWSQVLEKRDLPFWDELLPVWPYRGRIDRPSVPTPEFYSSSEDLAAVVSSGGIDEVVPKLTAHLNEIANRDNPILPTAIGVVLDQDTDNTAATRFTRIANALPSPLVPPSAAGVVEGSPRVGVYVMPGGDQQGTLEDLLLECAAATYPMLGCRAVRFVDGVDKSAPEFQARDLEQFSATAGRNKAVLAAMTAVLRPGKALRVSLQDNNWLGGPGDRVPCLARFGAFLDLLLGVAAPSEPTSRVKPS